MKEYWKKKGKLLIIACIAVIAGFIVMGAYAGIHYTKAGDNKGKTEIGNENVLIKGDIKRRNGKYYIGKKGGEMLIKLHKEYVNKLSYEYTSEYFSKAHLRIRKQNIYGAYKDMHIEDEYMKDMPRSVVNVGGKVAEIEIKFEKSENEVVINHFEVDNTLKLNPILGVFTAACVFAFLFILSFRKENKRHPAITFFVCSFVAGICLMLLEPIYVTGFDEQIHYLNAHWIGCTKYEEPSTQVEDYYYGYPWEINTTTISANESIEERMDFFRVMNDKTRYTGVMTDKYEFKLSSVGYLNQAFLLKIGQILHLPFYFQGVLGKLGNLLLYAVVMSFAIAILPIGKRLLMVIGMMPELIFQGTVYTYDIWVVAFLVLGSSILIREHVNKTEKFEYKWRILMIACFVLGCLPKAVYAPLILSGLFLGKDKFYSKRDEYIFKGGIIIAFLALMASFVLPALNPSNDMSDSRGSKTDSGQQMKYILGQPIAYAIVWLKNVLKTFQEYIMGGSAFTSFGYLGGGSLSTCCAALVVGTTLTDTYGDGKSKERVLDIKTKCIFAIEMILVIGLVWTALYISFTEAGIEEILGTQARYYYPFIFIFYLCFQTDKIKNTIELEKYQMMIMLASNFIIFQQMWEVLLVRKCL